MLYRLATVAPLEAPIVERECRTQHLLEAEAEAVYAVLAEVAASGEALNKEADPHKLAQRLKQLAIGKATPEYKLYTEQVHPEARAPQDPVTPDHTGIMSKSEWDSRVKKWRRQLHKVVGNYS